MMKEKFEYPNIYLFSILNLKIKKKDFFIRNFIIFLCDLLKLNILYENIYSYKIFYFFIDFIFSLFFFYNF